MAAREKKAPTRPATKTTSRRRTITGRRKAAAPEVTDGMIAERAYLISQSGEGASDVENWLRAEAELQSA